MLSSQVVEESWTTQGLESGFVAESSGATRLSNHGGLDLVGPGIICT